MRDEAGRRADGVDDPERSGGRRRKLDQQDERELGRDGRRQLSELLAAECAAEDCEGGGLGRQPELVRRGCDGGAGVARLEPVLHRDGDDGLAEEVERGTLAPSVGQAPRPHLAGTKRGTQVAWKESCTCGPRLSGADRRRTGDQLRGQGRACRRDSSRSSVHTFHRPIVRSIAGYNNGTQGLIVDQLAERVLVGRKVHTCLGKR